MKLFKQCIQTITLFIVFCLITGEVWAQKTLKDTTFVIVKQFQPTIADAYKINNIPVIKDSVPAMPKIKYGINSKPLKTDYAVEAIKPATMQGEPLNKLYNSLLKLAAGTHIYGEGFINNIRSKEGSYGAHLKHHSWNGTIKGLGYSGFSDNVAELYGKKFFHKQTLSGHLDYNRNVVHYYGYDTALVKIINDKDSLKQRYSKVGGAIQFQTHYTDTSSINSNIKVQYYNLNNYYKTTENNILAEADMSGYYDKQLIHLLLSGDYLADASKLSSNNPLINYADYNATSLITKLSPYITVRDKFWKMQVGIILSLETGSKSRLYFAPNINFSYRILEDIIIPYVGVTGGLKRNSMQTLAAENNFIIARPDLKNTNTKVNAYGGIKGSISKYVSYLTQATYAKYADMHFFVYENSIPSNSGFNLLYEDVAILNFHGEMEFQKTEKIKIWAKGDYNQYKMESGSRAWYKPIWQTTLSANYNLKNKIIATADVFLQGVRYTSPSKNVSQGNNIVVITTNVKNLSPYLDANIGLEYRYSKKLSGFVTFNNLAFKRYQLWNHYPVQSFNFLAGITMVF